MYVFRYIYNICTYVIYVHTQMFLCIGEQRVGQKPQAGQGEAAKNEATPGDEGKLRPRLG